MQILPFPDRKVTRDGMRLPCRLCGHSYIKRFMAGTVRGLRGEACLPCWMNEGMPK
jgi:hypothetical protein